MHAQVQGIFELIKFARVLRESQILSARWISESRRDHWEDRYAANHTERAARRTSMVTGSRQSVPLLRREKKGQ
jgi:hypothetical protein